MTDYNKQVEALRHCVAKEDGITICYICPYFGKGIDCENELHADAAAAIEALQAEVANKDRLLKVQFDEIRHLRADVLTQQDKMIELAKKLPKRGEWLIHSTGGSMATKKCPFCGSESWQSKEYAKVPKYCQNCGAHLPTFNIVDWVDYLYAEMEVQDGE